MKNHYLVFSLLVLAIQLSSCNNSDKDNPSGDSEELSLNIDIILTLVNDHRSSGAVCGSSQNASAGTLVWNDELAQAALEHSNDMQENSYLSHTGLNGSTFDERAELAGFNGAALGENIAVGYSTEEDVIDGWMSSTGHCSNIMNSAANVIGIAKSSEGNYWTMILGRE